MSENPQYEGNLSEELQNLGKNLFGVLRAAWDNPERKRVQDEILDGLTELSASLKEEAEALANSSTGQQIRSEVEELSQRVKSPEVQAKIHNELLMALQNANAELQKAVERWSSTKPASEEGTIPTAETNQEEV